MCDIDRVLIVRERESVCSRKGKEIQSKRGKPKINYLSKVKLFSCKDKLVRARCILIDTANPNVSNSWCHIGN